MEIWSSTREGEKYHRPGGGGGDAIGGWSNIKNQVGSVHRIAIYMYKNCVFLGFGYFLGQKTSKKRSFFTVCCELEA